MDFSSLYTEQAYALDIRGYKEKGAKLKKLIDEEVKATQSAVIRAYPNVIKMTRAQYKDLAKKKYLMEQEWDGQEYYLYRTPYNIMEIEVDG